MEILILEGGRGTGKSTLAFKLRQKTSETTLINFTGFHTDGEEGLEKVSEYYHAWMKLIYELRYHDSKFVFDRFYFSESVYSELYKDYEFTNEYMEFNQTLGDLSELGVKINIYFLTIDDEKELSERLMRDKVPFGKAEESVIQTLKQQEKYRDNFKAFDTMYSNKNLKVYTIDTSGKTIDDVYNEITNTKATN